VTAEAKSWSGSAFTTANQRIPALPSFVTPTLWAYIGESLANSPNLGSGGALANSGSGPVYPPGQGTIYGSGYGLFQTVAGTAALIGPNDVGGSVTNLVVCRNVNGTGQQSPLSSEGTDSKGVDWEIVTGTKTISANVRVSAASPSLVVSQGFTEFAFFALSHTDGQALTTLYDMTHGTNSGPTGTTTPRGAVSATPAWHIGESVFRGSANSGELNIAFVAVIPAALSQATITAIYASVKASLGLRGIII
jgi:hypothetical protein